VLERPPQVSAGEPYTVDERGSATLTATASDPEGGALAYDWDLDGDGPATWTAAGFLYSFDGNGDGAFEVENSQAPTLVCPPSTAGTLTVRGRIADKDLATTTYPATVVVRTAQDTIERTIVTIVNELEVPFPDGVVVRLLRTPPLRARRR
jgi:hypothetical protein